MAGDVPTRTLELSAPPPSPSAARPSAIFAPGEVLAGRFRIVRFLGQGGMGQVFEAFDAELGAAVALKAVRPEQARHAETIRRFKSEVYLARQVTHPNVCRIFELFQHTSDGAWGRRGQTVFFLTMELLAGESLADRLRRAGPLTPEEARPLIRGMAAALDAAHEAGIVHQDFKSSNVMLVPDGAGRRAVVTDFGLAQALHDDRLEDHRSPVRGGTPTYMAPELLPSAPAPAAQRQATPASDVYSFGVVVYEMLTGARPFDGGVRTLPPAWRDVLRTCLSRRPELRLPSAGEAVARAEGVEVTGRRAYPRTGSSAVAWALLVGLATALLSPSVEPSIGASVVLAEPRSVDELHAAGLEALRLFDFVAARDLLQKAVEADPDAISARSALAYALLALGDDAAAREESWQANELADGLAPYQRREVEALFRRATREWPLAVELYRGLWEQYPERTDYGLELAKTQVAAGRWKDALETLRQLRRVPDAPPSFRIDLIEARAGLGMSDFGAAQAAAARAVRRGEAEGSAPVVARAMLLSAEALWMMGELAPAGESVRQAARLMAGLGNQSGQADAWRLEGNVAMSRGEVERARAAYQRQVELCWKIGYEEMLSAGLHNLGIAQWRGGNLAEASRTFERFLGKARRRGDEQHRLSALQNLAALRLTQGELERAEILVDEGLEAARRIDDPFRVAMFLQLDGGIALDRGRLDKSEELYREALAAMTELGMSQRAAVLHYALGEIELLRDRLGGARQAYEKAFAMARAAQANVTIMRLALAALELEEGRPREALRPTQDLAQELARQNENFRQALATLIVARSWLALGKLEEAGKAYRRALRIAGTAPQLRLRLALGQVEVLLAAARDPATALEAAERFLAEAQRSGLVDWQFEARLELGKIELAAGAASELRGRDRLRTLAEEAHQRGYLLVARKASSAIE